MKSKLKSKDPDILASWPAIRRAARNARKLSQEMKTPFYVMQRGRLVDLNKIERNGRRKQAK